VAQEKQYQVAVSATTQYIAEQSDEAAGRFVFAYTIKIRNGGNVGLGVVGAQPLLKPGETYEYTSGTSIGTQVGTMRGSYQMLAEDGTRFEAPIPEFTLSVPRVLH
jgi:ApaG protein